MPVSIRDVARSAGVSHGTVSKVLNRQSGSYISDATRERVLAVASEMGYRPHRIARALATGRTNLVALWMTMLDRPYFSQVIQAVQEQARRHGYGIIVGKMDFEFEVGETDAPVLDWPVDGILALDGSEWLESTIQATGTLVPIVGIGSYHAMVTDYVGVDVTEGIKEAVAHVHGQGARRILFLGATGDPNDRRRVAYEHAAVELGIPPVLLAADGRGPRWAYGVLAGKLAAGERYDAIIGYNDDIVVGACRALREAGLRPGGDVLLVGVDGTEEAEYFSPQISSVKQPVEEMCRLGWEFLEKRIREPDALPQRVELKAKLVVRESSMRA